MARKRERERERERGRESKDALRVNGVKYSAERYLTASWNIERKREGVGGGGEERRNM